MGGTMRLGAQDCELFAGSLAAKIYGSDKSMSVIVIVMKLIIV